MRPLTRPLPRWFRTDGLNVQFACIVRPNRVSALPPVAFLLLILKTLALSL